MTLVVFPTAWVDFLPDTLVSPDVAVGRDCSWDICISRASSSTYRSTLFLFQMSQANWPLSEPSIESAFDNHRDTSLDPDMFRHSAFD